MTEPRPLHALPSATLIVGAAVAALFFNGLHAQYYALAMALLAIWAAYMMWQGLATRRLRLSPLILALLAFQGWLLVTLSWSPAIYLGAGYFWLLATPLIVVTVWSVAPDPDGRWCAIRALLVLLGLALAAAGLYQFFILEERPTATFINPNSLAAILNLLLLVAGSALLAQSGGSRMRFLFLAPSIAIMALVVGLISSRGALLGLAFGLAVMSVAGWLQTRSFGRIAKVLFPTALGFGVASILSDERFGIGQRIATLANPYSAGNDRFLIWGETLKMALERPFSGYGLGTYWQYWPQWRHPDDSSGGFWAHNDFLHLWVEAGIPAVILLAAVHVVLLVYFLRILGSTHLKTEQKLETVGLFSGLIAAAVHAQFTFNYYTLPILLVMSLAMARIERLRQHADAPAPAPVTSASRLRWIVLPAFALLVAHFAATGIATIIYERGTTQMREGKFESAERNFTLAQRIWGSTDIFYYTHAWLKIQQMQATPPGDRAKRLEIYREADDLVEKARANSPLRPLLYFIHGHLLVTAADLAGDDWLMRAEAAFAESIRRDPRYLDGRMTLARILQATNRVDEAYRVLQEGEHHWQFEADPKTQAYRKQLANLRSSAAGP